ncbi:SagB family peptide dehydrogenase [Nonomuraea sp. LPB2021202275-12-8]|uniref:SagB family peptide dehydrogenase n=1 Tax=Nonomuraea sp. LPB2021202275-12-8 TaxID=3120159 RepID=UPI00300C516F
MLSESYRLRPDAGHRLREDGVPVIELPGCRLVLSGLSVGARAIVSRLAEGWSDDRALGRIMASLEGEPRLLSANLLIHKLLGRSLLERRLGRSGRDLISVVPRGLAAAGGAPPCAAPYRMSRFAVLRCDGERLVADTPLGETSIAVLDPRVAAALCGPLDEGLLARHLALEEQEARQLAGELLDARILVGEKEAAAEREEFPLMAWEPQDLWLHHRSRAGAHAFPLGGTYPLDGRRAPEPVARTYPEADAVALPPPAGLGEVSLTQVLGERASVREHDDAHPITLAQLGEFLYQVQRLTVMDRDLGRRPYPTPGSLCDLEIYAVVNRCAGLDPGVYHHDSLGHRLERLGELGPQALGVLRYAEGATGAGRLPQVGLVLTCRVGRLMWKYESIAYALALKQAGVVMELMYLVATALGLAPCAVGTGDGRAFAAAAGLDPLAEPAVGDFVLGSRPAGRPS